MRVDPNKSEASAEVDDPRWQPDATEATSTQAHAATLVFAALFAGFSLLFFLLLPDQTSWVARAKLFEQPRFWPAIALGTMVLFSLGFLVQSYAQRVKGNLGAELVNWVLALEYVAWFLAYVWLVPRLGYLPMTIVFSAALAWRVGYRDTRWLGIAALFGIGVVVMFKSILGVNIPAGDIYEALPAGAFRSFVMTNF